MFPHQGNKWRSLQEPTANQNIELWISIPTAISTIHSPPKAERTLRKREQEDCESHMVREFSLRWCYLGISKAIPVKSHQLPSQSTMKAFIFLIKKFITFCSLTSFLSFLGLTSMNFYCNWII